MCLCYIFIQISVVPFSNELSDVTVLVFIVQLDSFNIVHALDHHKLQGRLGIIVHYCPSTKQKSEAHFIKVNTEWEWEWRRVVI